MIFRVDLSSSSTYNSPCWISPLHRTVKMKPETQKILVVEDDSYFRNFLKRILEKEGYEVAIATHGREGVEILKSEGPFSIITSDNSMPDMSGLEFLKLAETIAPLTKRIMVSSTSKEDIEQAFDKPDFLFSFHQKPVTVARILDSIDLAFEQYKGNTQSNRVLLADDNAAYVQQIKKVFADKSINAKYAFSAREALEKLQLLGPFAVVCFGFALQKRNGYEFFKRAKELFSDTTYILITKASSREELEELVQLKLIDDFLIKPINSDDLIDKINKGIEKYKKNPLTPPHALRKP